MFGNPTVVTGGNGRGKTSIADAIAFAVTGLPFFGERGLDRLHNEEQPDVSITMSFVDGAGVAHVLTRTRQKNRMTILYDGYEIRQMDLTELFGEKDVFLSIFNPLYFIEELGEDGKNLLERHLPLVTHEAVLAQLSDGTRAALEHEHLLSPETYLKNKRHEIRELEETVIYLQGQKDLADSQGGDWSKTVEDLSARRDALTGTVEALEAKRFDSLDAKAKAVFEQFQADDVAGLERQLAALKAKRSEDSPADSLRSQIQQLTADLEYGNLSEAEYAQLKECQEELRECAAGLKAAQAAASRTPEDFDGKIKAAQDQITTLKSLMTSVAVYISERAKLTFSALKMNRVEISLYDIVKTTGERKDVFKFTYGGRRYDRLFLSEKIRAGKSTSGR